MTSIQFLPKAVILCLPRCTQTSYEEVMWLQHGHKHTSPSSAEFKNSCTHLQGMVLHQEQGLDLPLCLIMQHSQNSSTTLCRIFCRTNTDLLVFFPNNERWEGHKNQGKKLEVLFTCIIHSIRYSCAIASLQLTTCSRIPGNTNWEKKNSVLTYRDKYLHTLWFTGSVTWNTVSLFLPVQYFNYLFIFQQIAPNCHFYKQHIKTFVLFKF